jgi:hypothetical protein
VHGDDLVSFARELGDGWKQGEQRIIHRRRYVRRKPVPRRPSMLDPYIPMIEEWLGRGSALVRGRHPLPSRSASVRSARQPTAAYGAKAGEDLAIKCRSTADQQRGDHTKHRPTLGLWGPDRHKCLRLTPQAARSLRRCGGRASRAACFGSRQPDQQEETAIRFGNIIT